MTVKYLFTLVDCYLYYTGLNSSEGTVVTKQQNYAESDESYYL